MKKAKNTETIEAEVNDFTQLCVWPGTTLDGTTPEEFEKEFGEALDVRIKFVEAVETLPDLDEDENPVPETGGRSDLFFYVHNDDIAGFALKRMPLGIRWWEDVIKYNNGSRHLYTTEFLEKHPTTW